MKVIGLTGGVGMGKSTCAELLRKRGLPVVDTDELARHVVQPGQPALAEIKKLFGPGIVGEDGALRRDELARVVFANDQARKELEAILHPRITALWRARAEQWKASGHTAAVVVIPLLFETGAEKGLDATICVACSDATQQERLIARGWSGEQSRQRIAAQWPVERKIAASDYVIWSEAGIDLHEAQLDRVLRMVQTG